MKKGLKPRKMPQQARSRKTREEILEATTRLLNQKPLGEVSTNHIAKKTGISVGTLYKYYRNKDSILADLSLQYMQKDAALFEGIFERHKGKRTDGLLDALVSALMEIHQNDARVRGVVYQNLERLKLVTQAQSATERIQMKGAAVMPKMNAALMWVTISAVNATVHSMSQLPKASQDWGFVKAVCRQVLGVLLETAHD
jgi:AcrR family transcriptional regulator